MQLNELDTPALLIDLDCMEDNLNRMATYCQEKNIELRPHIKTHKTLGLVRTPQSLDLMFALYQVLVRRI